MNEHVDATSRVRYPLRIGPTHRYLVDQDGQPTWIQGDSAWSIIVASDRSGVELYLHDRRRKGFNTLNIELIEHLFSPDPPRNVYGHDPFLVPGTLGDPNEAYFAHAEWVLRRAADFGFQVFLVPATLGYKAPTHPGYGGAPEGWYAEVIATGPGGCYEYGRYVGRRFGGIDGLVWVMAGDRCPGAALEHERAMVAGIREADSRHLFTAHANPECSPVEEFQGDPWLELNNTYTYGIVHRKLLDDYRRIPTRPFVLFESTYEGEHNASELQVRRQAWWALLCGACGQFLGSNPLWRFADGWQDTLDSPGAVAMSRLAALVERLPWWDLVPDLSHEFVVDGIGEYRGLDYCAAAAAADRSLLVAYMPSPRAITIDLRKMAGNELVARWLDPRTGDRHEVGALRPPELVELAPPGEHDWVLIVEAVPVRDVSNDGTSE